MPKLIIEVTEEEKAFLEEVAKIKGEDLGDLLKDQLFESFEDIYDLHAAELGSEEYRKNPEMAIPFEEYMKKMNIDPEKE
ncbi:hypothetical protein JZO70_05660 [Enterococcus sp. 669A]|uniref:Uncharacterized protein n=1 Tax=Candidatus Enterococcus moelleringii TaxID=2815325 RepID=A0ABS3L7M8_9ENTE|nr:DUF6290 family protein [Enterococcus sp. 669A]MBO1305635.1 hypothetical protein [Enterococcus sp. 669A]